MDNAAKECRKGPVQGKRVLVVDDDINLLALCQVLLEAHDYEACIAQSGAQAIEVMHNREVDAIVCDLAMPGLSGDLFYRQVGHTWPQLLKRFIFVTGNAENPIYEDFLKRAKATVLSKPLPIDLLLEKLQAMLGTQAKSSQGRFLTGRWSVSMEKLRAGWVKAKTRGQSFIRSCHTQPGGEESRD